MRFAVNVEEYDLDLTLKPSFASSLFSRVGKRHWVKGSGFLGGELELKQVTPKSLEVHSTAKIDEEILMEEITLEAGLWHEAFEKDIFRLPYRTRRVVEALATVYRGVRLPIVSNDLPYMVVAVALSKRTRYDRFVLRWCHRIWRRYDGGLRKLAKVDMKELQRIGTSYQIINLQKTLETFISMPKHIHQLPGRVREFVNERVKSSEELILKLEPEAARIVLLNLCWGLGPKTVDSIILSTFKASNFIPCDVHLKIVTNRLGLTPDGLRLPCKTFCSRYVCDGKTHTKYGLPICPLALKKHCLRSVLSHLGELGGWFQTLTYLHGRRYCRTRAPACSLCPVKNICVKGA